MDKTPEPTPKPTPKPTMDTTLDLTAFTRPDGKAGVRSHVGVMASVSCANGVVEAVARELPEVCALTHTEGCGRGPADVINSARTLVGIAQHPNLAALVVVGLGCEFIKAPMVSAQAAASGKPLETFVIQDGGGSQQTTRQVLEVARRLLEQASREERRRASWDRFVLGIECTGTDAATAERINPMLGYCADWVVERGGTVLLSDASALVGGPGSEALVASDAVLERVRAVSSSRRGLALRMLGSAAEPQLRADAAMLSTLRARSRLVEVVDNATAPTQRGLVAMDSPSSPLYALTSLAAGGAHVILQTTQHGLPGGFPGVPVIKVAATTELFASMQEDLDFDAGRYGSATHGGQALLELLAAVAGGAPTRAEVNGDTWMAMNTYGPAF